MDSAHLLKPYRKLLCRRSFLTKTRVNRWSMNGHLLLSILPSFTIHSKAATSVVSDSRVRPGTVTEPIPLHALPPSSMDCDDNEKVKFKWTTSGSTWYALILCIPFTFSILLLLWLHSTLLYCFVLCDHLLSHIFMLFVCDFCMILRSCRRPVGSYLNVKLVSIIWVGSSLSLWSVRESYHRAPSFSCLACNRGGVPYQSCSGCFATSWQGSLRCIMVIWHSCHIH